MTIDIPVPDTQRLHLSQQQLQKQPINLYNYNTRHKRSDTLEALVSLNSDQERNEQHKRGESPSEALFSLITVQERDAHHKRGVLLSEALTWTPPCQERAVQNVQINQLRTNNIDTVNTPIAINLLAENSVHYNSNHNVNIMQKSNIQKITCWYTNATSLNNKMPEFLATIAVDKPKLIFVTETWWCDSSIPNIDINTLYRKDRLNFRGGGVAIYVENTLKSSQVSDDILLQPNEQVWCEISHGSEKILLGCLYRPHMHDRIDPVNVSITQAKLLATTKYTGLLICGDFNLPAITWSYDGAINLNESDDISNSFFDDNLNDAFLTQFFTKPTFQIDEYTANNTLDLIISESADRIDDINHYPPLTSLKKAHHVLKWDLKIQGTSNTPETTVKRLYKKADYSKMSEHFRMFDWEHAFHDSDVNNCYDKFLNVYEDACNKFIRVTKFKVTYKPCKWMNNDIKNKIEAKNKLWFRCRSSGFKNKELIAEYNRSKVDFKRNVHVAKRDFELNIAIKAKHDPKVLYNYVRSKQKVKSTITSMRNSNGDVNSNPCDIVNILNNHFQNVFTQDENDNLPYFALRTNSACNTVE